MVPRRVTGCENDWLLFFHSHSGVLAFWSETFFQFLVLPLCGPLSFIWQFFSLVAYSFCQKRLSLFVLSRSCVSCLLSCCRCMFVLHSIGIALPFHTMQLSISQNPDLSPFFSSSRWGQVRPHCISSSEFGYLRRDNSEGLASATPYVIPLLSVQLGGGEEVFLLKHLRLASKTQEAQVNFPEDFVHLASTNWHSFHPRQRHASF